MKQFKVFFLMLILLFISACVSKIPFKEKKPLNGTALVNIYVTSDYASEGINPSNYKVRINNKNISDSIADNEYMSFNLKPKKTTISIVKAHIEEHSITLELKADKIYYLRVKGDLADGGFEFEELKESLGIKEIERTDLAGSSVEDTTISEIVEPTAVSKNQKLSKTDEIEKAYDMKAKGIISEEEFQALKTNILSK